MKTIIGIIMIVFLILAIVCFYFGYIIPYEQQPQSQFIIIKGTALNPDHIVSFWKMNGTLHLMTDTRSTFRNGNRDNYYKFKLTEEEMQEYWEMLRERRER